LSSIFASRRCRVAKSDITSLVWQKARQVTDVQAVVYGGLIVNKAPAMMEMLEERCQVWHEADKKVVLQIPPGVKRITAAGKCPVAGAHRRASDGKPVRVTYGCLREVPQYFSKRRAPPGVVGMAGGEGAFLPCFSSQSPSFSRPPRMRCYDMRRYAGD